MGDRMEWLRELREARYAASEALARAERRVTKKAVTKTRVTEIPAGDVTKKRGRPVTGEAMTAAERKRRQRLRVARAAMERTDGGKSA